MNTQSLARPSVVPAVPVIDISGYFNGPIATKHAIARTIDEACRTIGFIVISGHGVPAALVEQMRSNLKAFFDLPEAVKRRYGPPGPEVHRGYFGIASSAVAYSRDDRETLPDYREFFTNN